MATAEVTRGKKRARPVEPQPKEPKSEDAGSHVSGKRRKAKAAAARKEEEADLDLEAGLNKALERMDGPLLADHIAQKMKRFDDDLTTVELADLYIPGK